MIIKIDIINNIKKMIKGSNKTDRIVAVFVVFTVAYIIYIFIESTLSEKYINSDAIAAENIEITQQIKRKVDDSGLNNNIRVYGNLATNHPVLNNTVNDYYIISDKTTENQTTSDKVSSNKTTEDNVSNSKIAIENNELKVDEKLNSKQSNLIEISEKAKTQDETIILEDHNFAQLMDEVYLNIDKYEGKEIQLIGFVFRSAEYAENEFAAVRMLLTCCASDTQLTGFLCCYGKAMELERNSWVKVTGTIKIRDYNGDKTPIIEVEKVEKAEKPQDEYVYPN